jgi:hypothetical protein
MKTSPYVWSFGKTQKNNKEKDERRITPGPGMYGEIQFKGNTPTWK